MKAWEEAADYVQDFTSHHPGQVRAAARMLYDWEMSPLVGYLWAACMRANEHNAPVGESAAVLVLMDDDQRKAELKRHPFPETYPVAVINIRAAFGHLLMAAKRALRQAVE